MPRSAKPARLWLRHGSKERSSVWVILDKGRQYSTGCSENAFGEAERKLAFYIASKHQPTERKKRSVSETPIADVISVYIDDVVAVRENNEKIKARLTQLLDWWGTRMLSDVTPATCDMYALHRSSVEKKRRDVSTLPHDGSQLRPRVGGARRDLEELRAAINYHRSRDLHSGHTSIVLPKKGKPRTVWLTRSEVARLLWVCWRQKRSVRLPRGKRKGEIEVANIHDLRHLCRFILLCVYTGSRSKPIFQASIQRSEDVSFVDLDNGLFYRLPENAHETNKHQPTVPLNRSLLSHLKRWKRIGVVQGHVVTWEGKPIKSVKTAMNAAVRLAGIKKRVTPHTLRHTAVTWLLQNGFSTWETGGFAGMSETMVRNVYGHHSPDHLKAAAEGFKPKAKL